MHDMRVENGHFLFRTDEYPCGKEYMLIQSGIDEKGRQKFVAVEIWNEIPSYEWRWKRVNGTTAPKGYVWISNGKSRFSKERETALLREREYSFSNHAAYARRV